ncbi:FHA domain-containing protein [Microbacterium halophytorum]|uniref:FHA domain-containing protein n=1 Tax=Microbacterium halophytorum TaxID=2067568 RepID=UPI000CFCA189|nr:FHA domain-containing protein [Microbacterium halophytorum]
MSTPQQPGQDPQGAPRPFAAHAQVPVDPYALGAAAPLGGPDDPSAPPAPVAPPRASAGAEPAVPGPPPAGEPTPFGAVPGPAGPAQSAGPISFVPGVTQDPPEAAAPEAQSGPAAGAAAYAGGAAAVVPPVEPAPPAGPVPAAATAEPAREEPADAEAPAEPAGPAALSEPAPAQAAADEHPEPSSEQRAAAASYDTVVDGEAADPRLVWDDGEELALAGRVVVGRNPNDEDGATVVAVRDETLSLSKTHFEIELAGGEARLIDRHSTNGVTIVRAGERIIAEPGVPTPLRAGDALEMGDRIATFQEATA